MVVQKSTSKRENPSFNTKQAWLEDTIYQMIDLIRYNIVTQ